MAPSSSQDASEERQPQGGKPGSPFLSLGSLGRARGKRFWHWEVHTHQVSEVLSMDGPGGPAVENPTFQCWGCRCDPWSGNLVLPCLGAPKPAYYNYWARALQRRPNTAKNKYFFKRPYPESSSHLFQVRRRLHPNHSLVSIILLAAVFPQTKAKLKDYKSQKFFNNMCAGLSGRSPLVVGHFPSSSRIFSAWEILVIS